MNKIYKIGRDKVSAKEWRQVALSPKGKVRRP